MFRSRKRGLVRCLIQSGLLLIPFVLPGNAVADIQFVGGDSEDRGRLIELVSTRWPGDELAAIDLTITIGANALDDYCSVGESMGPVLAIHLYASHYRQSTANCRVELLSKVVFPHLS